MSEDWMFIGLRDIAREGEDVIQLSDGISLIRPNSRLLSQRWAYAMGQGEFDDEATMTRFLVCEYPSWVPEGNAFALAREKFYSGLMAIQIIKPVETSPFTYSRQSIERRTAMDAGSWARMSAFDNEMLAKVPEMIDRLQRVAAADNAERKNAVILLQLGLESFHPYIAGLLWVMGLEAIFDSADRNQLKRKLCDCLGPATPAFPNWNASIAAPGYTVKEIALHLYTLRSKLAHGVDLRRAAKDKNNPVNLTAKVQLTELTGETIYADILCQTACFLLCQVLQKVL